MAEQNLLQVPPDFPQDYFLSSIGGAQLKLPARKIGGQYVTGPTPEELYERYDACEDLTVQLVAYVERKLRETPGLDREHLLTRLRQAAVEKWDLSRGELAWIMSQIASRLGWPPPGGGKSQED